ncbi:MAG: response regulator [Caldilineaceae bacterium]
MIKSICRLIWAGTTGLFEFMYPSADRVMQQNRLITETNVTILVIDDTVESAQVLGEILNVYGCAVEIATGGIMALKLAQQILPDMILLDIKMPDMDGFEVCQRLKQYKATKDIPVIFISAINELFDKVYAFQIGAVDYISKPFQLEEVIVRVDTHLRVRRLHERLIAKNQVLMEAMAQLQETQQQLVESEKLAALGNLVAGIAHEVNTPIGIGVTAASTLQDETHELQQLYQYGQLTRSALEHYVETAGQSSQLILNNLQRASDLIQSLKQVSADQIHRERRSFVIQQLFTGNSLQLGAHVETSTTYDCAGR